MDEEYVQEHILTDGMRRQLDAPCRLIHGPLTAISLRVNASCPIHFFRSGCRCAVVESRRRSQQRDTLNQSRHADAALWWTTGSRRLPAANLRPFCALT
jgi:hypothetical protein